MGCVFRRSMAACLKLHSNALREAGESADGLLTVVDPGEENLPRLTMQNHCTDPLTASPAISHSDRAKCTEPGGQCVNKS